MDPSGIRIHDDSRTAAAARSLGARAFTVGNDIGLAGSAPKPDTDDGMRLLAHEAAHVLQFRKAPGARPRSLVSRPGDASERHADRALEGTPGSHTWGQSVPAPSAVVLRQVDQSAVDAMSPAEVRAHDHYIDNDIVRVEFFSAEQARIHYGDGSSLLIGLVPRWIEPPLQHVDYRSSSQDLIEVAEPGQPMRFLEDVRYLPTRGMTYDEVLRTFAQPVTFTVDARSGRIVPSDINELTAPNLVHLLRAAEAEYVRRTDEMAEGMVRVLRVAEVIVELELLRVTLGGARSGVGAGVRGAVATAKSAGTVTVEMAIEQGLVRSGGRLAQVLEAIQTRFLASAPGSVSDGLALIGRATRSVGLEPGVVTGGSVEAGFIELTNAGGVMTRILSTGEIIITRGADTLLRLIP